jgi:protein TonB
MLNDELNRRPVTRVARYATVAGSLAIATVIAGYGITHEPTVLAQAPATKGVGQPISLEQSIESLASALDVAVPKTGMLHVEGSLAFSGPRNVTGSLRISRVEPAPAQTFFFSGVISDQTDGLLPGVQVMLLNEGSEPIEENGRVRVALSDANGHFEFVGLPPGNYTWRATLPGFKSVQGRIAIADQNVYQSVTLALGTLTELVTIRAAASDAPTGLGTAVSRPADSPRALEPVFSCGGGHIVGGVIRAPAKIKHIAPRYPAELAAAGIGGVVILETVIDTNGFVSSVYLLKSAQPALDQAAIDAVREWAFTPARLNCTAVEVMYNVTASFVPGQ